MKTNHSLNNEQIQVLATIIYESMDGDVVDSDALDMLQELLDNIAGYECIDDDTRHCISSLVLSHLHKLKGE